MLPSSKKGPIQVVLEGQGKAKAVGKARMARPGNGIFRVWYTSISSESALQLTCAHIDKLLMIVSVNGN